MPVRREIAVSGSWAAIGSAFLIPSANTFGNYPINTLFGPHFIQQDLTLAKTFRITERFGFTLRTDAGMCSITRTSASPTGTSRAPARVRSPVAAGGVMRRLQFSGTIKF